MLLTKTVKVKWNKNPKYRQWYIDKGYIYNGKCLSEFEVNVEDLPPQSTHVVKVLCDYCKETIVEKPYYRYINENKVTFKDCCGNPICQNKKREETMINLYGVRNAQELEETKIKTQKTNLEKYGCVNVFQSQSFRLKQKETLQKKYGVENVSQIEIVKKKKMEKALKKYGVKYVLQDKTIREKIIKTNIRKYGFKTPCQNEEIKNKALNKLINSKYMRGTAPYSKQQEYLQKILKGELNYPLNNQCWIDIAFPNEKLAIEYHGSGHNLNVILGKITQEEFDNNEIKRNYLLKTLGWKLIIIQSNKDYLPFDSVIYNIVKIAKNYLNTGHSWIKYDIDNSKIITSQFEKYFDFGELRKIKKDDIQNVMCI